ncbi:MAG: MBL fold metallo-hydrolase [Desulfobacteraceae bacterium]|nr:MBL fold metallo-hydrolase [Desulfobacteraceae bacterium]
MKVTFLGVGESCDPGRPNTSLLVETEAGRQLLLDCGFTVPHHYFAGRSDPNQLDGLWISHFHGDHFFGVPLLQIRLQEMGRQKPLVIVGQQGIEDKLTRALDLAFPGFAAKLTFPLAFHVLEPGGPAEILGLRWQAAANVHSQRSLALRLEADGRSFFYSGDGRPTPETTALACGCDLAVHEAFRLHEDSEGHGSVRRCLDFAGETEVRRLALVHMAWPERRRERDLAGLLGQAQGRVFLPEAGEEVRL